MWLLTRCFGPRWRGSDGKPLCQNDTRLSFNLTHGQGAILIAVASGYEVGVDVEQVRPIPDVRYLAQHYFAPREIEHLFAIDEAELNLAFLQLWTRKEAYLKSLGVGLSHSLDSFEVTFGPGVPFRLHGGESGPWSLFHLEPFPDFVGALAVRGRALRLSGGLMRDVIRPVGG
jgi:4'-phosphopantetheinyl transferase